MYSASILYLSIDLHYELGWLQLETALGCTWEILTGNKLEAVNLG
jgi:hypothetical protein